MTEHELSKRLRIKAAMIEMGERIAWGSDSALMREAADLIDQLAAKPVPDDAELIDFLQSVARCDPKMDGNHVWWPLHWNTCQAIKGPTLREAIRAAIAAQGGK